MPGLRPKSLMIIKQIERELQLMEITHKQSCSCGEKLVNGICIICQDIKKRKEALGKEKEEEQEIWRLGGRRAYQEFTLEKFNNKKAIEESKCFYKGKNLFIFGSAGTGKTHLAVALIRQYPVGQVLKPQEIFRSLRGLEPEQEEERIERFINKRYLVIDDLGTEKRTDFSYSCIYEILDGHWQAMSGGWIITSNLRLSELREHIGDDRLCSRIAGMCKIIELEGKDKRFL